VGGNRRHRSQAPRFAGIKAEAVKLAGVFADPKGLVVPLAWWSKNAVVTAVQRNKGGTNVEEPNNDLRVIQWLAYGLRSKKNTCP
jgi:hypothetical protein